MAVAGTFALSAVSCTSASTAFCVAVGTADTPTGYEGVVVPVTAGNPGAPVDVAGTSSLTGISCAGTPVCVAVGTGPAGGLIVRIGFGQPTAPVAVAGTSFLDGIVCPATETCVAVGATTTRTGAFVDVAGGEPGAVQPVPGTTQLSSVDCAGSTTACTAVGSLLVSGPSINISQGAIVPIGPGGPGTVASVPLSDELLGVSCPTASTCVAVGTGIPGATDGLFTIIQGGVPAPATAVAGSYRLSGVDCLEATYCAAVGSGFFTIADSTTAQLPGTGSLELNGLACPVASTCEAVGATAADQGAVITESVPAPPPPPSPQVLAPDSVSVSVSPEATTVSWTEPAGGLAPAGYDVWSVNPYTLQRDPIPVSSDVTATSATLSNAFSDPAPPGEVTDCRTYRFEVTALDSQGNSTGPSPLSLAAIPYSPPPSQPGVAVILMEGFQSSTIDQESYDPLQVPTYCSSMGAAAAGFPPDETSFPESLRVPGTTSGLIDNFDAGPPVTAVPGQAEPGSGELDMTDAFVAHYGAVILPFSYNGAYFDPSDASTGQDTFDVNASPASAPAAVSADVEANNLEQEIASVHSHWPGTRIVVLAHSLGGLVASRWWYGYYGQTADHQGVAGIVTLDGVINGFKGALYCPVLLVVCQLTQGLGNENIALASYLWDNLSSYDTGLLASDDGSLITVGTPDDPVMAEINVANASPLLNQVLVSGCTGIIEQTCNVAPQPASVVSSCPAAGSGPDGHGVVKSCLAVIDYLISTLAPRLGFSTPAATTTLNAASLPATAAPAATSIAGFPSGAMVPATVSTGDQVTVTGSGLGSSGRLVFTSAAGPSGADAAVSSWSPTSITAVVPPGASSGPVWAIPASGYGAEVADETVLSPANGVSTLAVTAPTAAVSGQPALVSVTALGPGGTAVPGATVQLIGDNAVFSATTDGSGRATLQPGGFGTASFTVASGRATAALTVTWSDPPPQNLRLDLTGGSPATASVTLTSASGGPVVGAAVEFTAVGAGAVSRGSAITDAAGRAAWTFAAAAGGPVEVGSSADYGFARAVGVLGGYAQSPVLAAGTARWRVRAGAPFSYRFSASGTPPPVFSIDSGHLPAGLTLDGATGVLSGVPTRPGAVQFSVVASNGTGPDAVTGDLLLVVEGPPVPN